jgi:hypothetical protein
MAWKHTFAVTGTGRGAHVVKYRLLERGLILDKVTIDTNGRGLRESYLEPCVSAYVQDSG